MRTGLARHWRMGADVPDTLSLALVLVGAFVAGFTSGFAGFGTGLVASGLWFHALPAPMVPPLVALSSVASQLLGLIAVRGAFDWRRAGPYLAGGLAGVPLGVMALSLASPAMLRLVVGVFLVGYALFQLTGLARLAIGSWGGRRADGIIGAGGGILGGFAGLSGVLPLVWLQLRGGGSSEQRAVYQPFNLIVLGLAGAGMIVSGQADRQVAMIAGLSLPATLAGAWIGVRTYRGVSEEAFRRVVVFLLLGSGLILIGQMVWLAI